MTKDLPNALRPAAKGSGWSVKRDLLARRIGDHVLAVHPRRGSLQAIVFRAKPVAWDHLLWSILQIKGNDRQPASFHFTGAFTCDSPALIQQDLQAPASAEETAQQMVALAATALHMTGLWQGYDLTRAIADARSQEPYRYHMTRVVERIDAGDRQAARDICAAALGGELDLRGSFSACDKHAAPDADGRRPSLSFFQLAQIWMTRH